MEYEEDDYIRLFTPLKNQQEKDIYNIWIDNIEENIVNRKEEISEYCKKEKCDYLSALYLIYERIKNKFLCAIKQTSNEINKKSYEYWDKSTIKKSIINSIESNNGSVSETNKKNIDYIFSFL